MTAVTTLPFGRPLTSADLEGLPDDGHRYELIDGVLLVSSAPRCRTRTWSATCTCCCGPAAHPT